MCVLREKHEFHGSCMEEMKGAKQFSPYTRHQDDSWQHNTPALFMGREAIIYINTENPLLFRAGTVTLY